VLVLSLVAVFELVVVFDLELADVFDPEQAVVFDPALTVGAAFELVGDYSVENKNEH